MCPVLETMSVHGRSKSSKDRSKRTSNRMNKSRGNKAWPKAITKTRKRRCQHHGLSDRLNHHRHNSMMRLRIRWLLRKGLGMVQGRMPLLLDHRWGHPCNYRHGDRHRSFLGHSRLNRHRHHGRASPHGPCHPYGMTPLWHSLYGNAECNQARKDSAWIKEEDRGWICQPSTFR